MHIQPIKLKCIIIKNKNIYVFSKMAFNTNCV